MRRRLRSLVVIGAATVVASELAHRRASRRVPRLQPGRPCAVIVLGFRTRRDGRIHPLQRWRTEMAARTLAAAGDGVLVFSGGAAGGRAEAEAEVMARHARDVLGIPDAQVRVETASLTTWENVRESMPLVAGYEQIAIVSDPIHAARARAYVAEQHPELVERLVGADDYRFLERWWWKVATASYELALALSYRLGAWSNEEG